MAIACRKDKTWDYVPIADRTLPAEQQTKFPIKALSARSMAKVQDALADVSPTAQRVNPGTGMFEAVRRGVGVPVNLRDENGAEVTLATVKDGGEEVLADASLDLIAHLITELGPEVLNRNKLGEGDAGKSPASDALQQGKPSPAGTGV